MLDAIENFVTCAASHQARPQLQLVMCHTKRRLAVGTLRCECHCRYSVDTRTPASATQPSRSPHTDNAKNGA